MKTLDKLALVERKQHQIRCKEGNCDYRGQWIYLSLR